MRAFIATVFIAGALSIPANGQILPPSEIGVVGFYGYNMPALDFTSAPPAVFCCHEYQDGEGEGFAVGVSYRHFLAPSWALSGRFLYADQSIQSSPFVHTEPSIGAPSVGATMVTYSNTLHASMSIYSIEPVMEYHGLPFVTLLAGFGVGIPSAMEYREEESIIAPADIEYRDGTRFRVSRSGEIPDAPGAFISAIVGIGGRVSLTRDISLTPEIQYFHTFNDVMVGVDWKPHALRAGLAVMMRL